MDWTMRAMLWRSRAGSIGLRVMTGVLGVDDGVRVRDGQPVREVGPGGAVDVRIEHFVHLPEGLPVDAHSHHGTVGTGLVDQGPESFAEPDALALEPDEIAHLRLPRRRARSCSILLARA